MLTDEDEQTQGVVVSGDRIDRGLPPRLVCLFDFPIVLLLQYQ